MSPIPTGMLHSVAIEDLFFSMTDADGIITEANAVFAHNARYARSELIGSPLEVIHHPEMPAGLHVLISEILAAGRPACAYLLNLGGDGSAYWAFAAMVPVAGGCLAVRMTPSNYAARDLLEGVYRDVHAAELEAAERGMAPGHVALFGAALIRQTLAQSGAGSFEELMLDLVPAELEAREANRFCLPDVSDEPDDVQAAVADVTAVRRLLSDWVATLRESLTDTSSLGRDLRRTRHALLTLTRQVTAARSAGLPRDTARRAQPLLDAIAQASMRASETGAQLDDVVRTRKHLVLAATIAALHAETILRFIVARARGSEDPSVTDRATDALTAALLGILDTNVEADIAATSGVDPRVVALVAAVGSVDDELQAWCDELDATDVGRAHTGALGLNMEAIRDITTQLGRDAATIAQSATALDRRELAGLLSRVVADTIRVPT